jgi:hypothetical protein
MFRRHVLTWQETHDETNQTVFLSAYAWATQMVVLKLVQDALSKSEHENVVSWSIGAWRSSKIKHPVGAFDWQIVIGKERIMQAFCSGFKHVGTCIQLYSELRVIHLCSEHFDAHVDVIHFVTLTVMKTHHDCRKVTYLWMLHYCAARWRISCTSSPHDFLMANCWCTQVLILASLIFAVHQE